MWTEDDEQELQRLVKKRRQYVTKSGYDFKFMEDLLHGEEGEGIIKDALLKAEVKRDEGAFNTGNVFVEHSSWGKESGIATTEADWFLYLLGGGFNNEVFVGIRTDRLREILAKNKWEVRGGDNKSSKGKLLRLTKFFTKLYETGEEN